MGCQVKAAIIVEAVDAKLLRQHTAEVKKVLRDRKLDRATRLAALRALQLEPGPTAITHCTFMADGSLEPAILYDEPKPYSWIERIKYKFKGGAK